MSAADPLARPAWHALTGPQAALARTNSGHGSPLAWRIDPGYGPFAAAADGGPEAQAALAALLSGPDDEIWLVEPEPASPPPGTRVIRQAELLQMVAAPGAAAGTADADVVVLGEDDVPAMTALALTTRPGPWGPATHRYGRFYGIRNGAALVAMAGERLRPAPGLAEVSGVCTDPACRGQGFAGRLIRQVMAGFAARGDRAFLHTYADNAGAIALYRALGFVPARTLFATVLARV
jgi:ribosomal protein S18 acetylase RimI-like enzyme